jgi:hypothetical protein
MDFVVMAWSAPDSLPGWSTPERLQFNNRTLTVRGRMPVKPRLKASPKAHGAPTTPSGFAETVYAVAFDQFAALLSGRPAEDALKIQLLHYLPESTFSIGSRDLVGWTLSGAMVSLLAHLVGGDQADKLYRTRYLGMAAWMPVLDQLLEPLDQLILAHTRSTGWGLVDSELVAARVNFWELNDGRKFDEWVQAVKTAAGIRRTRTKPTLDDPHFRDAARIMIGEIKVLLAQLTSQSLASQKPINLIQFFEQQAKREEFGFLSDPHNLRLWLDFVRRNPAIFFTQKKRSSEIFDLFQSSVSGHNPDYIRQKRSRG